MQQLENTKQESDDAIKKLNLSSSQSVNQNTEISDLSFEQGLQRLEKIVKALESGDIELEQAINFYEEGHKLQVHCHNILQNAKLKVDKVIHDGQKATGVEQSNLEEIYKN